MDLDQFDTLEADGLVRQARKLLTQAQQEIRISREAIVRSREITDRLRTLLREIDAHRRWQTIPNR